MSRTGRLFSFVALGEAVTWAGLLIGMFLKYVTDTTDLGVFIFGRLHGGMFLVYFVVAVYAAVKLQWPWWVSVLAILAAVPPLVTLPLEVALRRHNLLHARNDRRPSKLMKRRRGAVDDAPLSGVGSE
ncbi:DUF3817 domain-containing protein [Microbacterium sp. A8/3-1]|uniref:DUF3817 domain-containing protein n=1 Tax=Microbacterium sp. A8/3-1 TaxID=3160749 RepID=A0AAU7VW29_9MICO